MSVIAPAAGLSTIMPLEQLVETKMTELGADEWRARQPFTIFRVPAYVRERSRGSYEPRMVSIGPYYHGAAELRAMEDHKWRYLHDCLRRNPTVTASALVREMRALEARARACYGERPAARLNAVDAFAQMLLLDGCFILEFFFKWHDRDADTLCDVGWGLTLVLSDLLLMENQIPFFVLVKLYEIIASPQGGSTLILNLVKFIAAWSENTIAVEDQPADEIHHLLDLYYKSFVSQRTTTPRATSRATELINHLLHLYYKSFVTQRTTTPRATSEATTIPRATSEATTILRATELSEVGVRFARRISSPRDRFYVKFDGSRGVLEIPTIEIDEATKGPLLANLIVLEQSQGVEETRVLSSYVALMGQLIKTAQDVELLRRRRVLRHLFADDDEAAQYFRRLGDCGPVNYSSQVFRELYEDVNRYSGTWWHRAKAVLRRDYFSTPWSGIKFVVAALVVFLTGTQTYFAVFPRK